MGELFTPARDRSLALAVRHVNASTPDTITQAGLWQSIQTGIVPDRYRHHVHAFLDETDLATLTDMVLSGAATYRQLAALADRFLPPGHDTRLWLRDRTSF